MPGEDERDTAHRRDSGEARTVEELERELAEMRAAVRASQTALLVTQRELYATLSESEKRYRLLVESGADAIYIATPETFSYVSPSVRWLFGYAPEELLGRPSLELIHPDDQEHVAQVLGRLVQEPGSAPRTRFRVRHRDGHYRMVEAAGRNLLAEPTIRGILINAHDVTENELFQQELRRSAITLRESQATLEAAQAVAHIGSWTWTPPVPDGAFTVSKEASRIFAFDEAFDGTLDQFRQRVPPEDLEEIRAAVRRAVEDGETYLVDHRVVRPDGAVTWVREEGIVERDDHGDAVRLVGTVLDITERRRIDEELRTSERRYRQIVETTTEGVWLTDKDACTTFVNGRLAAMLGYAREEMIGRSIFEFRSEADATEVRENFARRTRGIADKLESRLMRKDGTLLWVSMETAPVFDERGQFEGALAMVTDVTDRRRAEQAERQLRETEEQLRQAQKLEALGQLAGGVAHDFNNILSVILGYTSIVLEELPEEASVRPDVLTIHDAGQRANELTRQLLAFSRRQVLQPKVIDLDAILMRADKMLRRLLGEDIELVQISSPRPRESLVKADPGQLEQVVMNLAVNARDAMPSGGRLTMETGLHRLEDDAATPLGLVAGDYVMLSVADTGVGMDEITVARIFEPFFTTKDKGKGTGLGLSMVFGIVKQSGGHVWVESKVGSGSTFRILLPKCEQRPPTAEVPDLTGPHRSHSSETILLVEDDEHVRVLGREILRRAGYHVLEAANAGEALLVAEQLLGRKGNLDLLLTDVVMPRMGGHQLAERLHAMQPDLKVLYVSGYTDDTVLHHGVELGRLSFLAKPFTPATLTEKVREVLDAGTRPPPRA